MAINSYVKTINSNDLNAIETNTTSLLSDHLSAGAGIGLSALDGVVTFSVTGFTEGSVLFADSTGDIAENNAQLFWDNSATTLVLGNNLEIKGEEIDFTNTALSASYAPGMVFSIVADGTIAQGDLLKQSPTTAFRAVTVLGTDSDQVGVIGVALEAGTIGNPVRVSGAKLIQGRLDSLTTTTLVMTLGKSNEIGENGVLHEDATAAAIGPAAEIQSPDSLIWLWRKMNESF